MRSILHTDQTYKGSPFNRTAPGRQQLARGFFMTNSPELFNSRQDLILGLPENFSSEFFIIER